MAGESGGESGCEKCVCGTAGGTGVLLPTTARQLPSGDFDVWLVHSPPSIVVSSCQIWHPEDFGDYRLSWRRVRSAEWMICKWTFTKRREFSPAPVHHKPATIITKNHHELATCQAPRSTGIIWTCSCC